jgi:ferredoxin-NADP reductase
MIVAKTEQDLIFRDELRWLQSRHSNLHVCITLTRVEPQSIWPGHRGRVTAELLTRVVPNLAQLPVYLCGPNEMMDATTEQLLKLGVPSSRIHTEAFAGKKTSTMAEEISPVPSEDLATGMFRATSGATEKQTAKSDSTTIRFSRSGHSTQIDADMTILEAAETLSIEIPFECRSGICGQCKLRLLDGTVQMDCEDALSAIEKAHGIILACQARPRSDVNLEA